MEKLIITAVMIGGITTREKNPHPPMTPREIAESAIECHKAGASVCHIHVRDPHTQASSMKFELYKEVFDRVRDRCDLIINLTTGAGGRLLYDPAAGTWNTAELKSPEERFEHVLKLKPELCSLDVGTLNFGPRAFINLVSDVEKMAKMIKNAGVKPVRSFSTLPRMLRVRPSGRTRSRAAARCLQALCRRSSSAPRPACGLAC